MQVSQYKQLFLTEATSKLKRLEDMLIVLEKSLDDVKSIDALLQQLHALKGDAATMNYQSLANAVHQVEEYFLTVKRGERLLSPDQLDACFIAIDTFRRDIEHIRSADTEIDLGPAIAFTLRRASASRISKEVPRRQKKGSGVPPAPADDVYTPLSSYVDVSAAELESALSLVNTIVLSQQQLQRMLHVNDIGGLKIGLYNLATHASDLRKAIVDMKLIPVRQYFAFLARLVRDLSRQQKKFIAFKFKDNNMRFEAPMLESLREACVQLIKNAVDHGFREGDSGTVQLDFDFKGDKIYLAVTDTGHGIDWDALAAAAIRNGVATKRKLAAMKPAERQSFLIQAGVSSREKASLVSGRGIGLPMVRTVLASLQGSLQVSSVTSGTKKGTRCELIVPLVPTLFRALTWRWGSYYLALPLFVVEKIIQLPSDGTVPKVYRYQGSTIPARTTHAFVDEGSAAAEHAVAVAIVGYNGKRVAVFLPAGVKEQELIAQGAPILQQYHRVASIAVSEEGIPLTIVNHRILFEGII